ncbi:glycerate kinase family protein [Enterococcus songbeiensis]|uniref:glycerate kinase family protein n=1 Tax=Enterococcus songbeiensis TaxID=2559927 RepID=UPI0010F8A144|nr:glycerate kinase [Enterococcus songbeiensis]
MKVIISIDSFKGSISSMDAGYAIQEGIRRVYSTAEIIIKPLADGGEGTVDALVDGMGGKRIKIPVTGPLGNLVNAEYGIIEHEKIAIIEMSEAAGITLVPKEKRNPLYTTTYGVGEIIMDAIKKGCRDFIIGIGGSATNDGGSGMLQALNFDLLDNKNQPIALGAIGLRDLVTINNTNVPSVLKECTFQIACDVTNPLFGEKGSSKIFGPQKGATPEMVDELDNLLIAFSDIASKLYPYSNPQLPGAGAAGGLGFTFNTFLGGKLESGIDIVLETIQLEEELASADLVITGEGRLDYQTAMGKAPIGVARLAKKFGKTVIAFSGSATHDAVECNNHGIDAFFPILREISTLEKAMEIKNTKLNLSDTVEQTMRLLKSKEER